MPYQEIEDVKKPMSTFICYLELPQEADMVLKDQSLLVYLLRYRTTENDYIKQNSKEILAYTRMPAKCNNISNYYNCSI